MKLPALALALSVMAVSLAIALPAKALYERWRTGRAASPAPSRAA